MINYWLINNPYVPFNSTTTIDRSINVQYDNTGTVDNIIDTSTSTSPLYSYTYDALNRRNVSTISAYPGSNITLDDDYDRYGNRNRLTLTDSSGSYVHDYSFNKLNLLASASLPGSQVFNNIDYYDNNTLKQLTTPSDIIIDYLYEANGPVKDIKFTDNTTSNIIDQYIYTFDNVRNVDTITDNAGPHDYNYDGLYRLTQAIHPAGLGIPTLEDYIYDDVGNREDPGDSLLYDYDANNRITKSPSVASYSYDNDGNTTDKTGGEILTYDHDNRLTDYTNGTVNASYKYDPAGRRINKTVDGATTWYLWDGTNLVAEYDNSGGQLKRYVYLPNQFSPVQMATDTNIYDIHSDHLQTPKRLTDSNRNTVWQAHYESFGKVGLAVNTVEFNLRFPGQYYDSETGNHYNYFRDYDPSTGRYITSDPIGLAAGPNTYTYVGGNPLFYIDPLGLVVQKCSRPAQIAGGLVDHQWIKTDTKEAGMGPANGDIPGNESEWPYSDTKINNHKGESKKPGASCEDVPNVDENKVNELLEIGKETGPWASYNNCQSFVRDILKDSYTGPVPITGTATLNAL